MYKVFFKDRIVFLTEDIERDLSPDFDAIFKYSNHKELLDFILNFERKQEIKKAYIYHHDINELMELFSACFKNINAAGGVVFNDHKEILFIHRLGVWDLPKGKAEKGETMEETALREVEEECAINPLKITRPLSPTYHTYTLKGRLILKKTYWYEMKYKGNASPTPQLEEDITKAQWIRANDIEEVTQNTYPSILEVLDEL
ncbi:NUDIX hydrolase [Saccharicrinis fermentans]|uniref:RNA pyrophosphohydrolase n=1 Tax=Saccharicrinis fermentans DSM 9555 = JCM 21142 TaxID=869213 RepID=W7Y128_9BACT|nr:NUDIX domain-containing protein [Saccharicrinis fermentans]GAF01657.1 RNA pyrophosphohydrolase [Saccharicrinis fermentans DSM 9555 = JCM 21142]